MRVAETSRFSVALLSGFSAGGKFLPSTAVRLQRG